MSADTIWALGLLAGFAMGSAFMFCLMKAWHHRFLADGFEYLADQSRGKDGEWSRDQALAVGRAFGSKRAERAS